MAVVGSYYRYSVSEGTHTNMRRGTACLGNPVRVFNFNWFNQKARLDSENPWWRNAA